MARGRFLSKTFSLDRRIQQISDKFGAAGPLLIAALISHLDKNGAFYASPDLVKAQVAPRWKDLCEKKIDQILGYGMEIGLCRLYEVAGERYVQMNGFAKNQVGLRANRESTDIPEPVEGQDVVLEPAKLAKRTIKKTPTSNDVSICEVFDHYRSYHPRAHLKPKKTSKEWKLIEERLGEGYTVGDIKKAIDGNHLSPYHQGLTERTNGQKYDHLELIVRSQAYITKFIEIADNPPKMQSRDKETKNALVIDSFFGDQRKALK